VGVASLSIRVVVAAQVRLFREGLEEVLDGVGSLDVVASAPDESGVVAALERWQPDILLVETALLGDPRRVAVLLRAAPRLKIVTVGAFEDEAEVVAYAEAGVAGYVTREQPLGDLTAMLESVARGEMLCSPYIAATLLRRVASTAAHDAGTDAGRHARLTQRELEIVDLLAESLSNKEIARRLNIEVATVKNHVHSILEKLQVSRRGDAARWARTARA
jgi:DNA-binding NarL/FixJ family response regulator